MPRHPDASLLLPCVDPALSAGETDKDLAGDFIRTAQAYATCKQRHADLIRFEKGD